MIPVKYYAIISDQVRKGLEESYKDAHGANWDDAKEVMVQNIMNKLCEYLLIKNEDEDDE